MTAVHGEPKRGIGMSVPISTSTTPIKEPVATLAVTRRGPNQPGHGHARRLESEGLVAVDGEERYDGRLRRYFVLTDAGATALTGAADAAAADAEAARRRLAARSAQRPVLGS